LRLLAGFIDFITCCTNTLQDFFRKRSVQQYDKDVISKILQTFKSMAKSDQNGAEAHLLLRKDTCKSACNSTVFCQTHTHTHTLTNTHRHSTTTLYVYILMLIVTFATDRAAVLADNMGGSCSCLGLTALGSATILKLFTDE